MQYKVIITGAHGMIGEGVLLQCLENTAIAEVLLLSRRPKDIKHNKLKELIIPDFLDLDAHAEQLTGYHACFYCSEMPAASIDERIFSHFAIDIILSLATHLLLLNPNIVFSFLSKRKADTTELGTVMSDKIIGKVENALSKLIFRKVYFFRVGLVKPLSEQRRINFFHNLTSVFYPLLKVLFPDRINTVAEIGRAMTNALITKYPERVVKPKDIRALSTYHQNVENVGSLLKSIL